MGKQMNIGERKEHLQITELLETVDNNIKGVEEKFSPYFVMIQLNMIDNENRAKSLTLIVNNHEAVLYDNEDPVDMQSMECELKSYRRTKMFFIVYNNNTEEWTITRLANYLTTQY